MFGQNPHRDLVTGVLNEWENGTSSFEYQNDSLARRTQRIDNGAVTNFFAYNPRNELVGALMGTNDFIYGYDPIGNRIAITNNGAETLYLANALNQYTNVAGLSTNALFYDADGNLTNDGFRVFNWDGENRLSEVTEIDLTNGAWRVVNAYDYLSRRVSKKVYSWDTDSWILTSADFGAKLPRISEISYQ